MGPGHLAWVQRHFGVMEPTEAEVADAALRLLREFHCQLLMGQRSVLDTPLDGVSPLVPA